MEKENAELREELEYYRNRKLSGRQKHNAKWMAIYNDFVVGYESGMTMVEIAKKRCIDSFCVTRYAAGVGYLSEGNLAGIRKSTYAGRMQGSGRVLPERRTGE